jgi:hypothetical protein
LTINFFGMKFLAGIVLVNAGFKGVAEVLEGGGAGVRKWTEVQLPVLLPVVSCQKQQIRRFARDDKAESGAAQRNRRSFDCASARSAKDADRKGCADAPLRMTSNTSWLPVARNSRSLASLVMTNEKNE